MKRNRVIHAIFNCAHCADSWDDYQAAQRSASAHARKTGHTVNGEIAYAVTYVTGKPPSPPPPSEGVDGK